MNRANNGEASSDDEEETTRSVTRSATSNDYQKNVCCNINFTGESEKDDLTEQLDTIQTTLEKISEKAPGTK